MDFFEALKRLNAGDMITKLEWGNDSIYGVLRNGQVMLRKGNGEYYQWIISDGDMAGDDWMVVKLVSKVN